MADFLTLKKLEDKITDIIFHAKETLLILSPYIKLDEYFKKLFSNHLKNQQPKKSSKELQRFLLDWGFRLKRLYNKAKHLPNFEIV